MPSVLCSSHASCLAISILITCLLPCYQYSHHMPCAFLSVFSSQTFCLAINSLITSLLSSYQCSYHMPSVFLLVFSSHAFCLPIRILITCLLSAIQHILCILHLLLPRLMSRVCQRHTSSVQLPIFPVTAPTVQPDARGRGAAFSV